MKSGEADGVPPRARSISALSAPSSYAGAPRASTPAVSPRALISAATASTRLTPSLSRAASSLRRTFAYVSESSSPAPNASSCSGNTVAAAPAAAVDSRRPSSSSNARRATSCANTPNTPSAATVGTRVPTSNLASSFLEGAAANRLILPERPF